MTHVAINIDLSATKPTPSYDVIIGDGVLSDLGTLVQERLGSRSVIIVSDSKVAPLYAGQAAGALLKAGHNVLQDIVVAAGEGSKNFTTLQYVLTKMADHGADRKTVVVALGGGVIGDLAGLAAALYMRGIDVVQVPTTLLAQVDSSVGGKTAIDTSFGKNMVGAFYQPRLVVADIGGLSTLPPREMRAGYAEVIKYGVIKDRAFYDWCLKNGAALVAGDRACQIRAVQESVAAKARIVAADEKEAGDRALLNFGHTFAHALEAVAGYDSGALLHGEAVAMGMVLALRLSAEMGLCAPDCGAELARHFESVGLSPTPNKVWTGDVDRLLAYMAGDKKAEGGAITLILAKGVGQAFVQKNVSTEIMRRVWQAVG